MGRKRKRGHSREPEVHGRQGRNTAPRRSTWLAVLGAGPSGGESTQHSAKRLERGRPRPCARKNVGYRAGVQAGGLRCLPRRFVSLPEALADQFGQARRRPFSINLNSHSTPRGCREQTRRAVMGHGSALRVWQRKPRATMTKKTT